MRLFTGLSLPQDVVEHLEHVLQSLPLQLRMRKISPGNFHITTKFIGDWPDAQLPELTEALGALPPCGDIKIELDGTGLFQHSARSSTFFARVRPIPALTELAEQTSSVLKRLGIPAEHRKYMPHISLARISDTGAAQGLGDIPLRESFQPREFYLYESKMSIYSKLAAYPLK